MRVAELRRILETLDDDLVISVHGGHVQYIARRRRDLGRVRINTEDHHCTTCGGTHEVHTTEPVEYPSNIYIGATIYGTPLDQDDPPIRYHGRWPTAARQVINSLDDEP